MKIIFLDFDGVLNSADHFDRILGVIKKNPDYDPIRQIDPEAVKRLSRIVEETGAKVVISSTWRYGHTLTELREILGKFGFTGQIVGATPRHDSRARGLEIDAWLSERVSREKLVECFIILDDDADMDPHMDRLVQTSWQSGLLDLHVEKAIEMLGKKEISTRS